jgi:putative ABC transport system permease protein
MFGNYLKTALRSLLSQKLYTLINLAGLSVGLACFMLIMIFVQYELSYERFFDKAERIYRISQDIRSGDGSPDRALAANSPQVAPRLQAEFTQVEQAARLRPWRAAVSRDDAEQSFADALLADKEIFAIFDFVWLQGSPEEALAQPDSVVLTASTARRYFGDIESLGQTLVLDNRFPMRVAGVIQDLPHNTHLRFDMLAPMAMATSAFTTNALENWTWRSYYTYVLLAEGSAIADLEQQFPGFFAPYLDAEASSVFTMTSTALTDIHLHSNRQSELSPPGSMTTVNAFIVIALLVLLVACMNFMNLSTVQAVQRAREVGMRKALGGVKSQLMLQFLGESVLLTTVAVLIALVLVESALSVFGALLQRELTFSLMDNAVTLPFLVLLTLFVSLVSSGYPSLYLSSHSPALVLKGIVAHGEGAAIFRNALVVLQFSVAVALLIATATIFRQLNFLHSSDPGYDREQIVVLDNTGREGLGRQWDLLKAELLSDPEVLAVTASNIIPTQQAIAGYNLNYEGGAEGRSMPLMLVDYGYFETYGVSPLAGRVFSEAFSEDRRQPFAGAGIPQTSGTYIVNELAAAQLGWTPDEAIGKWIEVTCCNFGRGVVVGVVETVHYGSAQAASTPVFYAIPPEVNTVVTQETRLGLRQAAIRISGRQMQDTLAHIEASWKRIRPDQPMSLRFLEEDFNGLYRDEERQADMMAAFSLIAISITCIGLYGLAHYNAQRRSKEIGIRKVMGGSVWSNIWLLTNDFSKLVLLSNVIAWPLAYFAMNRWLAYFTYRIDLTPLIFIGSGLIAFCIAWGTVGGTAAKAASQKPVLALRYE